jgi:ferritin-like metal-binding protein YciE|tara:strand:+ start:3608 stop:3829 length:222 start_codon:yes stop_codon:yes gene_type:complete
MAKDRALRKVNKLLVRVEKHIEQTRDALEDLEIEFEVLKAALKRLKTEDGSDELVLEELDIENASNISSMQKF